MKKNLKSFKTFENFSEILNLTEDHISLSKYIDDDNNILIDEDDTSIIDKLNNEYLGYVFIDNKNSDTDSLIVFAYKYVLENNEISVKFKWSTSDFSLNGFPVDLNSEVIRKFNHESGFTLYKSDIIYKLSNKIEQPKIRWYKKGKFEKSNEEVRWFKNGKLMGNDPDFYNRKEVNDDFILTADGGEYFRDFLIENDALEEFVENVPDYIKKDFSIYYDRNVVDACISWYDSPRGVGYWSNLNNKWMDLYDEIHGSHQDEYGDDDDYDEYGEYDEHDDDTATMADESYSLNINHKLNDFKTFENNQSNIYYLSNDSLPMTKFLNHEFRFINDENSLNIIDFLNKNYTGMIYVESARSKNDSIILNVKKYSKKYNSILVIYDSIIGFNQFIGFPVDLSEYDMPTEDENHDIHLENTDTLHILVNKIEQPKIRWYKKGKFEKSNEGVRWYKNGKLEKTEKIDKPPKQKPSIGDDYITDDDFRNFLIENDAYDEYLKYTNDSVALHFELHIGPGIIQSSFIWRDTKSGHNYWEKLNKKWNEYCANKHIY